MDILIVIIFISIISFLIWIGCIRSRKIDWQTLSVCATLLAVLVAIISSNRNLQLTKNQISLQLRPFISVTNPSFTFIPDKNGERYWLVVDYGIKNFGQQPAHEYVRKNDKVLIISARPGLLQELEKITSNPNSTLTQKDIAFTNIIKARKETIEQIYKYLLSYPMATFAELSGKFDKDGVHCYGDISEHFPPPTVISPQQPTSTRSGRDAGGDYGQNLAKGEAVLVYYVYLTYEGAIRGKKYSTFYMGYYDERMAYKYEGDAKSKVGAPISLLEYRQWVERETL